MLRRTRTIVAALVWAAITLLFIGIGQDWWGWLAKLQFLPATMRVIASATIGNIAVVAGILLLTLLFGRIYCSIICPMGIFQDGIFAIRRKLGAKKKAPKTAYRKENRIIRYAIWAATVACLLAGVQVVISLLAPYSSYGRAVRSIVALCTGESIGAVIAAVSICVLVAIGIMAWLSGRDIWCNTICPVGTTLSFFSRFAIFRPTIDKDSCISCRKCEKNCRAHCIDINTKSIDYSRCVDCFDCIDNCPKGGLKFKAQLPRKAGSSASQEAAKASSAATASQAAAPDSGRRAFMKGSIIAAGTAITAGIASEAEAFAQNMKVDGGLAPVVPKTAPERSERITPPGSRSPRMFYSKCTACQLCVAACPNKVLRPSTDLDHLMQPQMSYENGWCRPECTACSDICPAGAILPVTREEKTAVHIGIASIDRDLCIIEKDGVGCGNCAHHCPAGAIVMVSTEGTDGKKHRLPSVIEDKCLGCGACEFLCPARPISAIRVNGRHDHINA